MPFPPLTRAQIRELDRRAIEEFGIPGIVLMENASRGLNRALDTGLWDCGCPPMDVLIVAGGGNNGGDGFALARHLHNEGGNDAAVALVVPRARVAGDAAVTLTIIERMGIPVFRAAEGDGLDEIGLASFLHARGNRNAAVIDCVFGTGLSRPVEGPMRRVIEMINGCGKGVISVDVPSGLDCDTGLPLGAAVRAALTVTFVAPKIGFAAPEAQEYLGRVEVVREIGIPREIIEEAERGGG